MTVSPAMWVTGNMASNMSLREKKTERGKKEGERASTVVRLLLRYCTQTRAQQKSGVTEETV